MNRSLAIIAFLCLCLSQSAQAYMGPGAGLSAIGSFLSLLGAIFFAIVGFVWYPVRRLLRRRPRAQRSES